MAILLLSLAVYCFAKVIWCAGKHRQENEDVGPEGSKIPHDKEKKKQDRKREAAGMTGREKEGKDRRKGKQGKSLQKRWKERKN